jgi:hypothetical protein
MRNDLDGALSEFDPVRTVSPEFGMATITGYTSQMDKRLQQRKFQHSPIALQLREQILEFNSAASSALAIGGHS